MVKKAYDIAGVLVTAVGLSYACAGFMILTLPDVIAIWSSVYYIPHIFTFSVIAFDYIVPAKKVKDEAKTK